VSRTRDGGEAFAAKVSLLLVSRDRFGRCDDGEVGVGGKGLC